MAFDEIYCDYCCDRFYPVEYLAVNWWGLNFCSEVCERAWGRREDEELRDYAEGEG